MSYITAEEVFTGLYLWHEPNKEDLGSDIYTIIGKILYSMDLDKINELIHSKIPNPRYKMPETIMAGKAGAVIEFMLQISPILKEFKVPEEAGHMLNRILISKNIAGEVYLHQLPQELKDISMLYYDLG